MNVIVILMYKMKLIEDNKANFIIMALDMSGKIKK